MGRLRVYIDTRAIKKEYNARRIRNRLQGSIAKNHDLYRELAILYAEKLDPFVPYKTGRLANFKVYGQSDGITYNAVDKKGRNYTEYQYYADDSNWNRTKYPHPKARSYWAEDDVRKIIWKGYMREAKPIILKYVKASKGKGKK